MVNKSLVTFKQRTRWPSRHKCGRSISQVVDRLRCFLLGWDASSKLAQIPQVWFEQDEWLRYRLCAVQPKPCRNGRSNCHELRIFETEDGVARTVMANSRRWWRNSKLPRDDARTIAWFDKSILPKRSCLHPRELPDADPCAGWCSREQPMCYVQNDHKDVS